MRVSSSFSLFQCCKCSSNQVSFKRCTDDALRPEKIAIAVLKLFSAKHFCWFARNHREHHTKRERERESKTEQQ